MEYVENIENLKKAFNRLENLSDRQTRFNLPEHERQRITQRNVHRLLDEESLSLSVRYAELTGKACEVYRESIRTLCTSIDESNEEGRKINWDEKMFRLTAMKELHRVEMERLDKEFDAERYYLDELVKIYNIQEYYTNADLEDKKIFRDRMVRESKAENKTYNYNINA